MKTPTRLLTLLALNRSPLEAYWVGWLGSTLLEEMISLSKFLPYLTFTKPGFCKEVCGQASGSLTIKKKKKNLCHEQMFGMAFLLELRARRPENTLNLVIPTWMTPV